MESVAFEMTDDEMGQLLRICAAEDKTPSAVVSALIQEAAEKAGLLIKQSA